MRTYLFSKSKRKVVHQINEGLSQGGLIVTRCGLEAIESAGKVFTTPTRHLVCGNCTARGKNESD